MMENISRLIKILFSFMTLMRYSNVFLYRFQNDSALYEICYIMNLGVNGV